MTVGCDPVMRKDFAIAFAESNSTTAFERCDYLFSINAQSNEPIRIPFRRPPEGFSSGSNRSGIDFTAVYYKVCMVEDPFGQKLCGGAVDRVDNVAFYPFLVKFSDPCRNARL